MGERSLLGHELGIYAGLARRRVRPAPWGRDFTLFMASEAAWMTAGRFSALALPWLVLGLGDGAPGLGLAAVAMAVPRLALMGLGGALAARYSSRAVMRAANVARAALLAGLALLIGLGGATAGGVALYCGLYGAVEGLFFPARSAAVPELVAGERRRQANALVAGLEEATGLVGPLLAVGAMQGLAEANAGVGSAYGGAGAAFAVAAGLALASVAALQSMSRRTTEVGRDAVAGRGAQHGPKTPGASMGETLAAAWGDGPTRRAFGAMAASRLLIITPMWWILPALAARMPQGVAALGLLTALAEGGAMLGAALAGALPAPKRARRGGWLPALGLAAAALAVLLVGPSLALGGAAALAVGVLTSLVNTLALTEIQARTPEARMGRMMSLAALR